MVEEAGTRSFGGFRLQQPPAYRACATGEGALASRLRWRPLGDAAQLSSDGVERNHRVLAHGEPAAYSGGIPPQAGERKLTVGGGDPITLGFLVKDYVDHLLHHLRHIGIEVG